MHDQRNAAVELLSTAMTGQDPTQMALASYLVRLLSGVPIAQMQVAMRHSDPKTTSRYNMAKSNLDRHASHRVASYLAGMTDG